MLSSEAAEPATPEMLRTARPSGDDDASGRARRSWQGAPLSHVLTAEVAVPCGGRESVEDSDFLVSLAVYLKPLSRAESIKDGL